MNYGASRKNVEAGIRLIVNIQIKNIYLIYQILINHSYICFKFRKVEKLENIIFYTIDKSIRSYRIYAQKRLRENGFKITIDQWLIIKVLMENPGISQQEIAEHVFKDNASVTRIIELLVKSGYLERKIHPEDRRKSDLKITKEGKKIIGDVQSLVLENRKNALMGITKKELETLHKTLLKITENCRNNPV